MSAAEWFHCHKPRPNARLRLYCFHHAGGGGATFFTWPDALPDWVEVHALRLPGRESRTSEAFCLDFGQMVAELLAAVDLSSKRFGFYGHSLGAAMAYGLARELRHRGAPMPSHFIVAARRAPHLPRRWASFHALPKSAFLARLQQVYGRLPDWLHSSPELVEHFLPVIRADLTLLETLEEQHQEPVLDCPILILGGKGDASVTLEELRAWCQHTTSGSVTVRAMEGDHLFPVNHRPALLRELNAFLAAASAT